MELKGFFLVLIMVNLTWALPKPDDHYDYDEYYGDIDPNDAIECSTFKDQDPIPTDEKSTYPELQYR